MAGPFQPFARIFQKKTVFHALGRFPGAAEKTVYQIRKPCRLRANQDPIGLILLRPAGGGELSANRGVSLFIGKTWFFGTFSALYRGVRRQQLNPNTGEGGTHESARDPWCQRWILAIALKDFDAELFMPCTENDPPPPLQRHSHVAYPHQCRLVLAPRCRVSR